MAKMIEGLYSNIKGDAYTIFSKPNSMSWIGSSFAETVAEFRNRGPRYHTWDEDEIYTVLVVPLEML